MIKKDKIIELKILLLDLEKNTRGNNMEIIKIKSYLNYLDSVNVIKKIEKILDGLNKKNDEQEKILEVKKLLKEINLSQKKESNKSENHVLYKEKINFNVGLGHSILDTGNLVDSNYTMYQSSKSHGYAAEKMNHVYDTLAGEDTKIVGTDNAKNGADRVVNGIEIQTKFCATGKRCITECLNEKGNFKYIDSKGNPMKIEVPKDKYDEAVKTLEEKIKNGKVPGVSDPKQAKEIVKKSPFTYEQAKNVAKFGTIESITYDAVEGIKTAGTAIGISAAMSFAHSIWNGEDIEDALKNACHVGIQVGGISWISTIAAKQLARTSFQSTVRVGTDALAKQVGPKVAAILVNASRNMTGGAAIYGGAAMKSFSKMMSGNIVTGVAMTVVLSTADVYRMFQGKASGKQVVKTVAKSAVGVAGGTGGMLAGAAASGKIGAVVGSVIPGAGTLIGGTVGVFVGGLFGAFSGGIAAQKVTEIVMDDWLEIKDDIDEMMDIFNKEFSKLSFDYLLSSNDVEKVTSKIREIDLPDEMRNMFHSSNRREHAKVIIIPLIIRVVETRKKIILPRDNKILDFLEIIF